MKGSTGYGLGLVAGFLFAVLGSELVETGLSDWWMAFYLFVCLVVVYVVPSLVLAIFEWRKGRKVRAKLDLAEFFIEQYKELMFAAWRKAVVNENGKD